VHRAEIMHFRGSWAEAEREAKRACEELSRYDLPLSGEAQYAVGEVRLRVGDLQGAQEAFRQAHQLSRTPEPGMSLLRLAQGDASGAYLSIKRALADVESRTFIQAKLLPAAIEIGLAAGDLDSVAQHVAQLEQIAGSFGTTAVTAAADYARGLPEHVRHWARRYVQMATKTPPGWSSNQRRRPSNVLVPSWTRSG
jgi:tetratricopeptide (TPR) repeat protein